MSYWRPDVCSSDLTAGGADLQKSVVASFVRDGDGNVSVKKVDYTLSSANVLLDTGGDTVILDKTYNVSQSSIQLPVIMNGVETEATGAAFDVAACIVAAATFEGDYANGTGNN